jgi:hypothetical protein
VERFGEAVFIGHWCCVFMGMCAHGADLANLVNDRGGCLVGVGAAGGFSESIRGQCNVCQAGCCGSPMCMVVTHTRAPACM